MATTLLYHRDPLLLSFSSVVLAQATHAGRPSVALAETAFYPEAGGQMADRGVLGGRALLDVQVDDDGVVHHVLDGDQPLPAPGATLDGVVDARRRRQHMAQHTAQHLLSRALLDENGKAETVSSRLGETGCTVDVDVSALSDRSLQGAEDAVNAIIDDDVVVTAFFPEAEQLARLPLRRRPKVDENIRVVVVGDIDAPLDASPCGGTHVTRTSQIGSVRVTGVEKYKGMTRVTFQAGARARREAFARAALLEELGRGMSAAALEVPTHIDKLRGQLKQALADKATLAGRVGALVGEALAARHPDGGVVVAVVEGADVELLRAVAARATALSPSLCVVCAAREAGGGGNVVVTRGSASSADAGALLKRLAAAHGGKGGGRADSAQGRLNVVDEAALRATVTA
ncbi:MAG: alanyl-tRNA editing protein [Deltaproteobacteria bacterium]|nr:alanyl-tRNA editing protein [Deltaproteobacteria bacterium]